MSQNTVYKYGFVSIWAEHYLCAAISMHLHMYGYIHVIQAETHQQREHENGNIIFSSFTVLPHSENIKSFSFITKLDRVVQHLKATKKHCMLMRLK